MEQTSNKRPPGRPRRFDKYAALDKAVRLFWRHGYEATSMSDLVAAMGIGAPSLYAAFGNKADLFAAVVDRYGATFSATLYGPINDPDLTVREAVEGLFDRAARLFTEPETPAGCFMYSAATAVSPSSGSIEKLLRERRLEAEAHLAERLQNGVEAEQLPSDLDPVPLARFFNCVLEGMSMQARDGATEEDLRKISLQAMKAWPDYA
ncbi:TetR/AcrR family transcriptional regulator [Thalassovita aquimarina]|uniref:TetR/AcrR family transcriptional regulator n=1 Tax=Thalassovita aquimarina TaxID=2785917 RepID=A0ABS5HX75_9RHOB|nr:TetR/AcrR family transcriptional regulator [Thalassovita aquimarina]